MIYSVSKLQREFGLPFTTAEAILREQMMLARRHSRRWYILFFIGIVAQLACSFAPWHSPFFHAGSIILSISSIYLAILLWLTWRRAQASIRTAARAAARTD